MVTIHLKSAGKKFLHQWVFRKLDLQVQSYEKIAITGFNGSGKSTLLQIISGFQSLNEGSINYFHNNMEVEPANWYKHISFAAPYLDLPDEYTLHELVSFYASFKPFLSSLNEAEIVSIIELDEDKKKPVKYFSSGMKQRLRLALAMLSDVPVVLLDEPLSNLDKRGEDWYKNLINNFTTRKTVIVCSNNIEDEIFFCARRIHLNDYKM